VKSGQGNDRTKKPVKFPGLLKKLQAEAAKKAPKGEQNQGGSGTPHGFGFGKKR
jgi:hypothetical protein